MGTPTAAAAAAAACGESDACQRLRHPLTLLASFLLLITTTPAAIESAPPPHHQAPSSPAAGRVEVKIYDHRAYHDPESKFGHGPWHYFSHGYGVNYMYEPDLSYQRERGYHFEQGFMRDLCDGRTRPCVPSTASAVASSSLPPEATRDSYLPYPADPSLPSSSSSSASSELPAYYFAPLLPDEW